MNKYEQLIEHIINDETDKARELFHTIVVEKSRDIYENLIDEQDLAEIGGNEVEDLVDEITIDEQGMTEEEMYRKDKEFVPPTEWNNSPVADDWNNSPAKEANSAVPGFACKPKTVAFKESASKLNETLCEII